jgi:hypothetical protein
MALELEQREFGAKLLLNDKELAPSKRHALPLSVAQLAASGSGTADDTAKVESTA